MSYEEAFLALKAGEYERAAKPFEPAAREMGYGPDIINNAYTLALHLAGDKSRLADVVFRVGKMLLPLDPASALDYFHRALFAGLDGNRSRQIGEVFEEWSEAVREEDGGGEPSGPIRSVAHVVGCLLPGHAPSIYLQSLTRSLNSHGIASTVFTTEWASSWFFNPKDVGQSQQLDIDADMRIASVEGDFFERAERVADAVRQSGCGAAFYHASLAEQITARVAALHPASVQVNVNHGGEMAAALFDASIHLFHNALERTQFPDRQNTWIPLASDIEARLDATPPADLGIPLIVNTSSGIMNTDSGHREHSPERSDGLASQFIPSESRFSVPAQPVDATHALNVSAGVANSSVLRGRSLSCRATASKCSCECSDRFVLLGK